MPSICIFYAAIFVSLALITLTLSSAPSITLRATSPASPASPASSTSIDCADRGWVAVWNGYDSKCCVHGVLHLEWDEFSNTHVSAHATEKSMPVCRQETASGVNCFINAQCRSRLCHRNFTCF
jgi:hypothetical protein